MFTLSGNVVVFTLSPGRNQQMQSAYYQLFNDDGLIKKRGCLSSFFYFNATEYPSLQLSIFIFFLPKILCMIFSRFVCYNGFRL